ncbi:carbohydrate ABC transporter permease [Nocardia vaccinii]|uniref:carbohydrate ABC transporter permease n=1 Tax=Nocardia vaccinii TaxID=1822 RepID=UPI001C3F52D4|nr:sugar ABC transporter permease [Nocardia vaccinii]
MSFRDSALTSNTDHFVGAANYHKLWHDRLFWQSWWQTIEFATVTTCVETLAGLGIALTLNARFPGRGAARAMVLVPWAIPSVVTGRMFNWLFDQGGAINYLLVRSHLATRPVEFLGSTTWALRTLMIADIWKTTPFMALLLLAGLQTIPPHLTEVARLDGISAWGRFRCVVLPLLLPSLLVAALLRMLDAVRVFDLPYAVTGGGPASSTETLSTYSYNLLFAGLDLGSGSAVATATFVAEIGIGCAFGIFVILSVRRDGRS